MLPRRIVVLALIPGSSSVYSLDRCFSSCCVRVFWDSFGANVSMLFSVSSRMYGLVSVKPDTRCGNISCSTTFSVSTFPYYGMDSSKLLRMVLSLDAKSFDTMGMTRSPTSSSGNVFPIDRSAPNATAGAPPNSNAFPISGNIFRCYTATGSFYSVFYNFLKNTSFSALSFTASYSKNSTTSIN